MRHEGGILKKLKQAQTILADLGMPKSQQNISWETEVWISDFPEHMIHFNGNKFLGPSNKVEKI